jgi:hypothetical protein
LQDASLGDAFIVGDSFESAGGLAVRCTNHEKCLDLYHKCDRGAAGNFLDLPSERFLYIDEVGDYCVQAPF